MTKGPIEKDIHNDISSRAERIQSTLVSLAHQFITLSSNNIDDGINQAIATLGQFADVDRAWIIQINQDAGSNTHEWCAEGIPSVLDQIQNLPIENVPWIAAKLTNREVVQVVSLDSLPEEAIGERELCKVQGLKSFLAVPLLFAGTLTGLFGFDMVREERAFPEDVINLLKIAGEMIGNALHRRELKV